MLLAMALAPLLVTLDSWEGWKSAAAERGWQWLSYEKEACNDAAAKGLESLVSQRANIDRSRVYLIGRGDSAACVFYNASRLPDLWAAAVAVGGDVQRAIETNKIFEANLQAVPILWVTQPDPARRRPAGTVEREQATVQNAIDFLAGRHRVQWPEKIDCETGNPNFLRCFWLEIARVDLARRNDALPSSRLNPGSGAKLLPGPIKPDDRILSINGRDPARFLADAREEKNVAVMVQRGKERLRLETKTVIPPREEGATVRVQAEVQPEAKEILIITRGIAQLRLTLPPQWAPGTVNWNGVASVKLEAPGCHLLAEAGGSVTAAPCR
jgi:hypothetical protein